ncbi:MAG: carboxypeptidase regulatory-like domain-containing protein [Planctomycetes bacterium]|nr:carboxypeptidase regulatory-like domain-containing protein [Planctomycetota bacterium]
MADISGGTLDSVKLRLTAKKGKAPQSTQSDNNGYFEFKDVTENTYYIRAQKEGYKRVKSMVVLQAGEIKEIKIDMKLKPPLETSSTSSASTSATVW